jgi:ankyrin repeat protein
VLHYAAYNGAPEDIIKALIDTGVDPQAKDNKGISPADYARKNNQTVTAAYIEQFYQPPIKSANFNI